MRKGTNMSDFFNDAYQDSKGVWRWKSSNNVPFDDMLEKNGISVAVRKACAEARDKDNAEFAETYRKRMENYVPSAEEMYEMRAAFGPGAVVVNVLTGRKIQL